MLSVTVNYWTGHRLRITDEGAGQVQVVSRNGPDLPSWGVKTIVVNTLHARNNRVAFFSAPA
jgi:hypothetical protein